MRVHQDSVTGFLRYARNPRPHLAVARSLRSTGRFGSGFLVLPVLATTKQSPTPFGVGDCCGGPTRTRTWNLSFGD